MRKTRLLRPLLAVVAPAALGACAAMTPTYETESAYLILDGANREADSRGALLESIVDAVKRNLSSVRVARDIPPSPLPQSPGRFSLQDLPFSPGMAAMVRASGTSTKVPVCETPVLTLSSEDSAQIRFGEQTNFFVCTMQYASGYRTVVYASYSRASGGVSTAVLGATIGRAIAGDTSQFIPRTMDEIRSAMSAHLDSVRVVDSYIPSSFKGPFVDQRDRLVSKEK